MTQPSFFGQYPTEDWACMQNTSSYTQNKIANFAILIVSFNSF